VDVSDPTSPSSVGGCSTGSSAYGAWIAGDYAYVADYTNGLQVIDISDPTTPVVVAGFDSLSYSVDVDVAGDYAYVADGNHGMTVFDISNPLSPVRVARVPTGSFGRNIDVDGDHAYVAAEFGGVYIFDISDPTNPTLACTYDTYGIATGVAVDGDYLYIADMNAGVQVLDITDPSSPVWAGTCGVTDEIRDLALSGDHVYVVDYNAGFFAYQISQSLYDHSRNVVTSTLITDAPAGSMTHIRVTPTYTDSIYWEVSFDGGTVFYEEYEFGIWHELYFPLPGAELVWRATLRHNGGSARPACSNLVIEWRDALTGVDDQELPSRFAMRGNSPNPFNPTTEIAFDLPVPARVRLAVYAVDGRCVAVLEDGPLSPGRHKATWQGRDSAGNDLPSGVYFARLEAGKERAVHKMVLLK